MLCPIKGLHSLYVFNKEAELREHSPHLSQHHEKRPANRDCDTLRAFQNQFLLNFVREVANGGSVGLNLSEGTGQKTGQTEESLGVESKLHRRGVCRSTAPSTSMSGASSAGLSASSPSVSGESVPFPSMSIICNDSDDDVLASSFPRPTEKTWIMLPQEEAPPDVRGGRDGGDPSSFPGLVDVGATNTSTGNTMLLSAAHADQKRRPADCNPSHYAWLSSLRDVRIVGANAAFGQGQADHSGSASDGPVTALLKALSTRSGGCHVEVGLRRLRLERCRGLQRFPIPLTHFPALTELELVDCPDLEGFAGPADDRTKRSPFDAQIYESFEASTLPLKHLRIEGCRRFASFEGLSHHFGGRQRSKNTSSNLGPLTTPHAANCNSKHAMPIVSPTFPALATITVLHSDALSSLHGLEGCHGLQSLELTWCPALATFDGLPQPLPRTLRRIDAAHSPLIASVAMFLQGEEMGDVNEDNADERRRSPPTTNTTYCDCIGKTLARETVPPPCVLTLHLSPWCEARTFDGGTITQLLLRSKRRRRAPLCTTLHPVVQIVWNDH